MTDGSQVTMYASSKIVIVVRLVVSDSQSIVV